MKMTEKPKETEFSNFEITKFTDSIYLNPYRLQFDHKGHKRVWDGYFSHPSVSCLLYHTEKRCIVLVRQFRPVVYVNQLIEAQDLSNLPKLNAESIASQLDWSKVAPESAITFELCAGICDKSKPLEETVKEEILEECGYEVEIKNIHRVKSFRSGVGLIGALHTIFYAEVNEKMKVGGGGGIREEGECIEIYELPESQVKEFIDDESKVKPPGLLFAMQWFLHDRKDLLAKLKS